MFRELSLLWFYSVLFCFQSLISTLSYGTQRNETQYDNDNDNDN
eukprot:CAMPEP_0168227518 /NCGR_PEP_ID=MMETSP0140_2-20121125/14089_1 /TAXON_ID=44445 /ORGANISM="Pseudo-nitzschia australis, Strain 10249 10 AB" /LENGTH=43 /DNA_ID= /DNA_START= /DNA_END= /DNA_ORIENTATION=